MEETRKAKCLDCEREFEYPWTAPEVHVKCPACGREFDIAVIEIRGSTSRKKRTEKSYSRWSFSTIYDIRDFLFQLSAELGEPAARETRAISQLADHPTDWLIIAVEHLEKLEQDPSILPRNALKAVTEAKKSVSSWLNPKG